MDGREGKKKKKKSLLTFSRTESIASTLPLCHHSFRLIDFSFEGSNEVHGVHKSITKHSLGIQKRGVGGNLTNSATCTR